MSVKAWKPKHMFDLPAQIAKWEHEQNEHHRRTGQHVLTESLRQDMLMQMVTPEVKAQVEAAMLLVDESDLTYDKLKKFIVRFVNRQLPPGGGSYPKDGQADALQPDHGDQSWYDPPRHGSQKEMEQSMPLARAHARTPRAARAARAARRAST